MAIEKYYAQFFSLEDLIKDLAAITSGAGRGMVLVFYKLDKMIYVVHPLYNAIGIHYYMDEKDEFPAGDYAYNIIDSTIKAINGKSGLNPNEIAAVIIKQKNSELVSDVGSDKI
ncbi:MAG: hypothetical protein JRM72_01865 [Nitrososphaerota archaeon]|nr:hypothetical protein [Nitrososphaerota archaeon]